MPISKNIIDRSDITTYPVLLKWPNPGASITISSGVNRYVDFTSSLDPESLLYRSIKQLYYNEYLTGSLLNSSSYWNDTWQSTAAQGTLDADYRYFPIDPLSQIMVIQIDRSQYGQQIGKGSLVLNGGALRDDANGNIVDSSGARVGNVFYNQGIIVITDPNAQPPLPSPPPAASPTPAASTIVLPSVTPTPTTSTLVNPSATPTPTPTTSTLVNPSATPTPTPTISITPTRTVTPTPTPTISITPTRTVTPTPSLTPTPSPNTVLIVINGRVDPSASPSTNLLVLEYSTNGGTTWTEFGAQFDDTACSQRAAISVVQFSTFHIRVKDTATLGVMSTNLALSATCPSYDVASDACNWQIPTISNRTVSFNVNIDNQKVC